MAPAQDMPAQGQGLKDDSDSHTDRTEVDVESNKLEHGVARAGEQVTEEPSSLRNPNIVDFDGKDDPENALNWPTSKKVPSIALISIITLLSPIASTIISAGTEQVMAEFNSTNSSLAAFVTTVFVLGYAAGPLAIAPCSELYGRAIVYQVSGVLFLLFNIGCALANNLAALIILRFLAGIVGSCPVTLGAGSIGDMVRPEKRGAAMAAWVFGPLFGPVVGPIMGGYISPDKGWRWTFWAMSIASGVLAIATILFIRETYPYTILERKTARLRKETGNPNLQSALVDNSKTPRALFTHSITRPLRALCSPIVLVLSVYVAIIYSYLYLFFTSFPYIFEGQYGFSPGEAGLATLGLGIGSLIGLVLCGALSDPLVARLAARNGGERLPEYRLPVMIIGGFLIPIGLFWYAWSAQAQTHWAVPIVGTGFVGCGMVIAMMATSTYLVDAYTTFVASTMAASMILRSLLGGLLPLAGGKLYEDLGVGWGTSVLGFIAVAFIPVPFVFYKFGRRVREMKISQLT